MAVEAREVTLDSMVKIVEPVSVSNPELDSSITVGDVTRRYNDAAGAKTQEERNRRVIELADLLAAAPREKRDINDLIKQLGKR